MNKKIYLVRHGMTECGEEKRYIGTSDIDLSEDGIRQIGKLKEYFSGIELEKAYSSPLKRCALTLDIILERRNIEKVFMEELKEIKLGDWENQPVDYIKRCFPALYEKRGANIDTFIPPGGENFEQLQKRVMPAFQHIVDNIGGNGLVIAHAGVNRVILCRLLGIPLNKILDINQPHGCINILTWNKACEKWEYELIY